MGADGRNSARITATLPKRQHAELERIAKAHGVSVAWVVRKSLERTIEEVQGGPMLPLFGLQQAAGTGDGQ
jgi:hypothetical protein